MHFASSKIRYSSRWWILFKLCSEIRHCRSNERSFWSFRRFDGFHAVTVTIAAVHKETYEKPKVIKSIAKTEQDNKTVSYQIFSKCRIRISLNGGCYRSAETDTALRDLHNCTANTQRNPLIVLISSLNNSDHYTFLGNCPPTPPLSQRCALSEK